MKGIALHPVPVKEERSLFTLVENRSAFTMDRCELNVFETHQRAEKVNLVFGDMLLTSMLRGKKVMHLFDEPGFDYMPGESVIVPPNEMMKIDFPEARNDNPTQCIALAISSDLILETVNQMNEHHPKEDLNFPWKINDRMFHLINNQDLGDTINRIIRIGIKEHNKEKDLLAKLALHELLIRLMQTQARQFLERNYRKLSSDHRFAYVIQFIKENIREKIDMDVLSEKACMSRANFFRKFREEVGVTPGEYILEERIRLAKDFLKNPNYQITEICFMAGFQNLNNFIRVFKKETGFTPKAYQVHVNKKFI